MFHHRALRHAPTDEELIKAVFGETINLIVAQADYGKSLIEKDASKYTGVAQMNLLAAQGNDGKNYPDWKAEDPLCKTSIEEARTKIASTLVHQQRSSYDVIISETNDELPDLIAIAGVRSF